MDYSETSEVKEIAVPGNPTTRVFVSAIAAEKISRDDIACALVHMTSSSSSCALESGTYRNDKGVRFRLAWFETNTIHVRYGIG